MEFKFTFQNVSKKRTILNLSSYFSSTYSLEESLEIEWNQSEKFCNVLSKNA